MSDSPEPEIIPPRPRGRPRKTTGEPDPSLLRDANPDGDAPAAAARKPKSRASKADRIAAMADDIEGAHELMALMLGMPFLAIDATQAARLAKPAFECCQKYGFEGGVGPELKLLFASAAVYAPMAVQVGRELQRRRSEAAQPGNPSPGAGSPASQPEPEMPAGGMAFGMGASDLNGHASRDS